MKIEEIKAIIHKLKIISKKYFKGGRKMEKISKFIPMEGNSGNLNGNNGVENAGGMGGIGTQNAGTVGNGGVGTENSTFRVCNTNGANLPVKTTFWSKLKSILTYEIKVELTPYEQKIEDEINEFLHQEITWQGFKDFLFQDITFGKKKKAQKYKIKQYKFAKCKNI